jgi:uncharacterized protein
MNLKTGTISGIAVLFIALTIFGYCLWQKNYADKPIVDNAQIIKDSQPILVELFFLNKYSNVNFRIVTVKSLKGNSIDQAADKEFAKQKKWSSMNPDRAALLFIALEDKTARLKYGSELKPVFEQQISNKPLIRLIQEDQLDAYFSEHQSWNILSATLNIIIAQLFERFPLSSEVELGGELPPIAKNIIQDDAGIITSPIMLLETMLQLRMNFQIDMRIATTSTLDEKNIDTEANKKFQEMNVGDKAFGKRGLLLFVAPKEQLVRLEVGYELEKYYPDGFIGYIEREQLAPYFKSGQVFLGITETIKTIMLRGIEQINDVQQASSGASEDKNSIAGSGGGGAKIETKVSSEKVGPENTMLPESIRKQYKACNTPRETFSKFISAWQQKFNDPTLEIYTKETQIYLTTETISGIEMKRIAEVYSSATFDEKIQGNRAVLMFEKYPSIFLKKSSSGWQIDLATMVRTMLFKVDKYMVFDGMDCVTHPYRFAYPDFRYKTGDQPDFLTKGVDKNGPWLGVTLGVVKTGDFSDPKALYAAGFVLEVCPSSPAEKAGLQYGDIIMKMGDQNGAYAELIPEIISSLKIGDKIDIYFYRGKEGYRTQAVIGENLDADYF